MAGRAISEFCPLGTLFKFCREHGLLSLQISCFISYLFIIRFTTLINDGRCKNLKKVSTTMLLNKIKYKLIQVLDESANISLVKA